MSNFTVAGLTEIINRLLPEPHAGLLAGLLFGTKTSLSPDVYQALVTTGTLHIVALSGMNITIMIDMIGLALMPVIGVRWASITAIGVIGWFVWFVGMDPPIVRAAIMGSISLFSVLAGRQYWGLISWGIASGSMLIVKPEWLFDISFQLSVFASLGIILFGKTENKPTQGLIAGAYNYLRNTMRLTLAAQVFTVPLIFFTFHRISIVSPCANVAIGWIIAPLTMLGWATVLTGWMVLYAGQILGWIDWLLLEYLVRTVFLFSSIPFAGVSF